MARLRDPATGCEWDVAQTFQSIAPYTIEEAYEVADAIAREDLADLRGELGDLLLQVVFHARMAEEQGAFDFDAVAKSISDKMEARHPHIFGDAATSPGWASSAAAILPMRSTPIRNTLVPGSRAMRSQSSALSSLPGSSWPVMTVKLEQ